MTDVFISYSRKDKAFVQRLFTTLEAQGHDAWVDWDDIEYAEDWWRKIQAGIEGADSFVFIISPSSARSKVCFDEVQHADDNHKRIVPLVIEDVTEAADTERMHPALKRQNWLFFRPADDFDAMLATLLETLRREPEHVQMHTRLLVNAHEWQAHDRDDSLALRGENLQRALRWLAQVEGKSPTPTDLHRAYIAASQKAEQRRRQRSGIIGGVVVVVLAVIALVAFTLFQQTQRDQDIQASLTQADLASTPFAEGDMFNALALAVDANQQIPEPPGKSLSLLREIAAAPGPIALFSSGSAVTSLAFGPDRSRIVSAHADGSLKLWDATQGVGFYDTPLYATSGDMLHVESIASVAIGPAGRYVVSAGCFARDPDNEDAETNCLRPEINLWEIADDTLTWVGCGISKKAYVSQLAAAFERRTGIKLEIQGGGATKGIRSVAAGTADIGGSCRNKLYDQSEEQAATLIPVAWDALVVIVHPENPVQSLSLDQVREVYTGEITNWAALGGPDLPIELYTRQGVMSGVGHTIRKYVFGDPNREFGASVEVKSSGPLEKAIEAKPTAIGITGISSARKRNVKVLSLNGKQPTYDNIKNGDYLLYRPLYLAFRQDNPNAQKIREFIKFAHGAEGQEVLRENGTVPYFEALHLMAFNSGMQR